MEPTGGKDQRTWDQRPEDMQGSDHTTLLVTLGGSFPS